MTSAPVDQAELRISLSPYTSYLEDPNGVLNVDQVSQLPSSSFYRHSNEQINLGKTKSVWWLKASLNNSQNYPVAGYLEINYPLLDDITVFFKGQGSEWRITKSGDHQPFTDRPVQVRNFWFPVELQPGENTLLIRVHSTSTLFVPLFFSTYLAGAATQETLNAINGAFYGVLFAMFCYNLFLYVSLREKAYFWYLIYSLSAVFMALSYDGILFKLIPSSVELQTLSTHTSMYLLCLSSIQFSRHFLHTHQYFPRIDKGIKYLMLVSAVGLISLPMIGYISWSIIASITVSIVSLSLIICGLYVWRRGLRYGSYYSLAWTVLLVAFVQATAGSLGFEALGTYSNSVVKVGVIIELMTLSIGLADRINLLKEEGFSSRRAAEQATSESLAKSHFLAKMSHEIRTPLNGVLGMLQLLQETPLNHSQRFYLDTIASSGRSLIAVINDILDYSRIESGKLSIEHIEFDLEELLSEIFNLFTPQSIEKRLSLYLHLENTVPRYIKGDPTRLKQVLLNLLGNALKFTNAGHVALNVSRKINPDGSEYLNFEVCDSGIGISPAGLDKLFESFGQVDSSTSRHYGGSGLGLVISKELVEMMGGQIDVQSSVQQGSRFTFTTPHIAVEQNIDPLYLNLKGRNALLCSLDSMVIDSVSSLLERWGMRTEACKKPEILSRHLETFVHPPLLVLIAPWPGTVNQWLRPLLPTISPQQQILLICKPEQSSLLPQPSDLHLSSITQPLILNTLRYALKQLHNIPAAKSVQYTDKENALDAAPPCILIAEDNIVNQLVVQGLLKKRGYNVRTVTNGLEVVAEYQRDPSATQLILMDCEMPKMDGFEATRQIRKLEQTLNIPATPIIALTAHILAEHRQQSRDAGMNGFLSKPLDSAKLYSTVEAHLHELTE